jgi:hypothetical protein
LPAFDAPELPYLHPPVTARVRYEACLRGSQVFLGASGLRPTIKELIHEEFGDGIMSAINFRFDISRVPDPAGDRVVVTLNGKFLPYQW